MRRRSLFEVYSEAVHRTWQSIAMILLRLSTGVFLFFFGLERVSDWHLVQEAQIGSELYTWLEQVPLWVSTTVAWLLLIAGIGFIVGAFVRPLSILACVLMVFFCIAQFSSDGWASMFAPLAVILFLFTAGGAGHILGLDSVLYHYARSKNWAVRFLFG